MADQNIPERVAILEEIARTTASVLARIESRLDRMDDRLETRFNRVDDRFSRIDARFDALTQARTDDLKLLFRLHMIQLLFTVAGIGAVLGVIARAQHWI